MNEIIPGMINPKFKFLKTKHQIRIRIRIRRITPTDVCEEMSRAKKAKPRRKAKPPMAGERSRPKETVWGRAAWILHNYIAKTCLGFNYLRSKVSHRRKRKKVVGKKTRHLLARARERGGKVRRDIRRRQLLKNWKIARKRKESRPRWTDRRGVDIITTRASMKCMKAAIFDNEVCLWTERLRSVSIPAYHVCPYCTWRLEIIGGCVV